MKNLLALCLLIGATLPAQNPPAPTDLPGSPFSIKQTWNVGGSSTWDYLTVDPQAHQLLIAHGPVVQVVDTDTGEQAGQVSGLREAHGIALDDSGQYGYVTDGPANQVKVFDRRTFKVVAVIPAGTNPRAIVFEPQTRLLFAVSADPLPQGPGASGSAGKQPVKSAITVIDASTRTVLGKILLPGKLGFAQTGGSGQIYVCIVDRNEIAWIDVSSIEASLHDASSSAEQAPAAGKPVPARPPAAEGILDWSAVPHSSQSTGNRVRFFTLGPECRDPRGLAVDSGHLRLFAACNNMKMDVLNASTGELVASVPIGPGTDAVGYDADRGLIYTANGGAYGSLTIIRQDVTDTYAVIQTLPTSLRARTLAVNPVSGEVYVVADHLGVAMSKPGGSGTTHIASEEGSFQVIVAGR
jgi:YVTN family beta-propeller protein